ncbi:efflux RND transporter periplasmic adaptor subunit [Paracoccus homiensis]|uniref:efflux RND transporter periplasmic adaptor subunit n=1 Tax=Paracoccus homiensis TaxID=364199 RepID=UPI00398C8AC7
MSTQSRILVAASIMGAVFAAGTALAQQGGEAPPPAVTVVTLQPQDVTLTSKLPGRVVASAEAEIKPQVTGIVTERLFSEGSHVSEGDPLYRIDPRTYQASVAQAEASLAQARAQADAATREADRIAALRDRSVVSEQSQDTAIADRDAALAAVQAAEAQLQAAQINLNYTTITAPLDGVIGLAQTSAGALVSANQATPLATIRSIDSVYVDVTQSAADIVRWQRQGAEGGLSRDADRTVTLELADGSQYDHEGSLTAAEPQVNETTGVVTLRMEFDNPEGLLLPGMYVLVEMPQAQLPDAILAPQEGVTRDRRGRPVAMVANADNVIEERQLDIIQDLGNQWVVRDGLQPGDRIVVEGLQKIGSGMTVTPEERQSDDAAEPDAAQPEDGDAAPEGETTEAGN